MWFVIFFFGLIWFCSSHERFAKVLTALLTFGFLVPFFIFATGGFGWLVCWATDHNLSYLLSCLFFGVPMSALVVAFVYFL